MADTLEQELHNYFTRLNEQEKISFIKLLKDFLAKPSGNKNLSLEAYTAELEKADAEIEAGDFILHEDVVKYFSKK
ncbi:MAG: hypothetical protein JNM14_07235 [Ferruginibacter sp.]|nr:hypothetical protein [Ferruginibacter sp.]